MKLCGGKAGKSVGKAAKLKNRRYRRSSHKIIFHTRKSCQKAIERPKDNHCSEHFFLPEHFLRGGFKNVNRRNGEDRRLHDNLKNGQWQKWAPKCKCSFSFEEGQVRQSEGKTCWQPQKHGLKTASTKRCSSFPPVFFTLGFWVNYARLPRLIRHNDTRTAFRFTWRAGTVKKRKITRQVSGQLKRKISRRK